MQRECEKLPPRQRCKIAGINKTPLYVPQALEPAFEQSSCVGVSIFHHRDQNIHLSKLQSAAMLHCSLSRLREIASTGSSTDDTLGGKGLFITGWKVNKILIH